VAVSVIATTSLDPLIVTASALVGIERRSRAETLGRSQGLIESRGFCPHVSRRPKAYQLGMIAKLR
jgi:hypothetical protein